MDTVIFSYGTFEYEPHICMGTFDFDFVTCNMSHESVNVETVIKDICLKFSKEIGLKFSVEGHVEPGCGLGSVDELKEIFDKLVKITKTHINFNDLSPSFIDIKKEIMFGRYTTFSNYKSYIEITKYKKVGHNISVFAHFADQNGSKYIFCIELVVLSSFNKYVVNKNYFANNQNCISKFDVVRVINFSAIENDYCEFNEDECNFERLFTIVTVGNNFTPNIVKDEILYFNHGLAKITTKVALTIPNLFPNQLKPFNGEHEINNDKYMVIKNNPNGKLITIKCLSNNDDALLIAKYVEFCEVLETKNAWFGDCSFAFSE